MYGNVIGVELGTSVVPSHNVLTSCRDGGRGGGRLKEHRREREGGKERDRERESERVRERVTYCSREVNLKLHATTHH